MAYNSDNKRCFRRFISIITVLSKLIRWSCRSPALFALKLQTVCRSLLAREPPLYDLIQIWNGDTKGGRTVSDLGDYKLYRARMMYPSFQNLHQKELESAYRTLSRALNKNTDPYSKVFEVKHWLLLLITCLLFVCRNLFRIHLKRNKIMFKSKKKYFILWSPYICILFSLRQWFEYACDFITPTWTLGDNDEKNNGPSRGWKRYNVT